MKFKIKKENSEIEEVSGEEVKLKGYKGFRFFMYKDNDKEWCLRELTTGTTIATNKNKIETKKIARNVLNLHTSSNKNALSDAISEHSIINTGGN